MKHYSDFSVDEWLNYLENSHQQEIQLGLTRVREVAETLNLIVSKAKIITIAGTNGKGSTVAALEAIYLSAGFKVGSYTSPHLLAFNERIKINHKPISDEDLCRAFTVIEQGRAKIDLTYFEIATLAALWHFKQQNLDLIILEVGLGGRLDATNIVDSDLAIITTVDLDHQDFLGDNREAIGFEKAGILRASKPFIFADKNPPSSIVNQAAELHTSSFFYGLDYDFLLKDEKIELKFQDEIIELPKTKLHPHSAMAAVIASLLLKENLPLNHHHCQQALNTAFISGRLQFIHSKVNTLVDVAHNPQAANYLAQFIKNYRPKSKIYAVFSALADKDLPGLIEPLLEQVDYWIPALLSAKRAASREQLAQAFGLFKLNPICYDSPLLAYKEALTLAKPDDIILVYGSFYTVAAIMDLSQRQSVVDKMLL